jgi:hypothetical protein
LYVVLLCSVFPRNGQPSAVLVKTETDRRSCDRLRTGFFDKKRNLWTQENKF